ncbi:MAG: NAD(+) synthase [Gemmatimonadales bacterium]|nr:MAG: NAD(+) synthase [Gemmatimonadales bacterium]
MLCWWRFLRDPRMSRNAARPRPEPHRDMTPDPSRDSDASRVFGTSADSLRISLAQFRPRKGRVAENLEAIGTAAADASAAADLLVFPETATSGYFVEGGVEEVARTIHEICLGLGTPPGDAPDLVLGAYERGPDGVLYNSALHLEARAGGWALVHVHRKMFLPTYGLFDEARFVKPGLRLRSYDTRFGRMGLLICEEMLHSLPPTVLALGGAELLVALSASPAREYVAGNDRPASLERWDVAARAITLEHGVHLALAHLAGSEGGKIFAGGSALYGPGGRVLARGPLFTEARVDTVVSLEEGRRGRVRSPMLEDLRTFLPHLGRELERAAHRREPAPPAEPGGDAASTSPAVAGGRSRPQATTTTPAPPPRLSASDATPLELENSLLEQALVSFLGDEVERRRGFRNVVVGVSGGVDSAVTLALAVRAFGPERVRAFLLPYATSSEESLTHGELVCETFGVEARRIPITASVNAYIDTEAAELSPRRRGNLAARFRALVLWDQAAAHDALILGTGNKSERLLGYFTWHADDSPPVNPVGDLLKSQVWSLARHLGVPDVVVDKAPSADLEQGVHDEDELGVSYAVADLILHWLLEGLSPEQLVAAGFSEPAVTRVHSLLQGTHWKRRPPTTALVSSSGIGDFYLRPVDF